MGLAAKDSLLTLVNDHLRLPADHFLELIRHPVGVNWRERYLTPQLQARAIPSSLVHAGPYKNTIPHVVATLP
jgi:hypothetical protein